MKKFNEKFDDKLMENISQVRSVYYNIQTQFVVLDNLNVVPGRYRPLLVPVL